MARKPVNDGFCALARGKRGPFRRDRMLRFRQLAPHFPALVIDAASACVQVGVLRADGTAAWHADTAESGVAVFRGVERLGVDPLAVAAFVFCDGPGSVLGIRTAAMALRTWHVLKPRPLFAYSSLADRKSVV